MHASRVCTCLPAALVATGAGAHVTLRGLTIGGQGGSRGIRVVQAAAVHIERCVVTGMTASGIEVDGPAAVLLRDSIIRDNSGRGIRIGNAAGGSTLRLDGSRIERNGSEGIAVDASAHASVRDTTVDDNGSEGLVVRAGQDETIVLDVARSSFRGNAEQGVSVNSASTGVAIASVTDSVVAGNGLSGILAYSFGAASTRVAADRNVLIDNLASGLSSVNTGTIVIASNNVAMRNDVGFGRYGGGALRSLGNNLVELNITADTDLAAPTIVPGK